MISMILAIIVAIIFTGLALFQLLLVLGLPYGKLAFGGKYDKLPANLRINSLIAIGIFIFGIIIVLERSEIITIFTNIVVSGIAIWVYAGYLAFNTFLNLLSKSKSEKLIMTPISLLSSTCCFIIAIIAF
jgi:hypothetical protein